jgi:hypothetical protein
MSSHIDKEAGQPLRAEGPPHRYGQSALMETVLEILHEALKDVEEADEDGSGSGIRPN